MPNSGGDDAAATEAEAARVQDEIERRIRDLDLLAAFRAEGRTSYVEADERGNVVTRVLDS